MFRRQRFRGCGSEAARVAPGRLFLLLGVLLLGAIPGVCRGEATPAEERAMRALGERVSGVIIWESNRTGFWELYVINTDGSGFRQLSSLTPAGARRAYETYLRPRISPDGATVLFAYGKPGGACEAWTLDMATGQASKRTVGNPLNWSPDGTAFYLVRDSQVWKHDFATGAETRVHDTKLPVDGNGGDMVGTLAPNLKDAVFRSPARNEYIILPEGKLIKTMGGCEPRFSWDGSMLYWVGGPRNFRVWNLAAQTESLLLGTPPVEPFNYTYFPTVSADGRWLLYGASPSEHDHSRSDYEIYIQELKDWSPAGEPVRLSFDKRTDRWPFLWLGPTLPATVAATAPEPPAELPLFLFAGEKSGPEFGGDWGLWPQVDGCRGTTTFLAGGDAEGKAGGAMQIEYDIRKAPQSFSLWTTPDGGTLDLSAYDRLVVYAKGPAPSFTLVVKDRNAGDPDAPEGIADAHVTGLTADWQRIEVPFTAFVPRQAGARVDWQAIGHIGFALIAPADRSTGTLSVDNLRAARGQATAAAVAPEPRPAVAAKAAGPAVRFVFAGLSAPAVTNAAEGGAEVALTGDPATAFACTPDGLNVAASALLATPGSAAPLTAACRGTNEFSLSAWIKPAGTDQQGPARIVTLSADTGARNVTLGQEGDRYVVRFRTSATDGNGLPPVESPGGCATPNWTHVAYTRAANGDARLYIDGREVSRATVGGNLSTWDDSFRLAVANELTGDRPWLGTVRAVRIYARAISATEVVADMAADAPRAGARAALPGDRAAGRIVWESNRTGVWQLYSMDLQGGGFRALTAGADACTEPAISPDGTRILFTRTRPGKEPVVQIMAIDGSGVETVIGNASTPLWRANGERIHFLRQPKRGAKTYESWEYDPKTKAERHLFPRAGVDYGAEVHSGIGNDDGSRFVSWSPNPRGTWVFSPDGTVAQHVHGGCQGRIAPDGVYGYGVKTAGIFVRFDLADGGNMVPFLELTGDWSHTYYPRLSRDGSLLVFSACPPDQHDHETSDYEVFLVGMKNWKPVGAPVRLTFDKRTDRAPSIFVGPPAPETAVRPAQGAVGG